MAPQYLVDIYVRHPNSPGGVMLIQKNVSRDSLETYSDQARHVLSQYPVANETHRIITLPYGVPAALSKVLHIISSHKGRGPFYIGGLKSMSNAQRCYIWQACDIFNLADKEAWARVTRDLKYRISHNNLTPETIRAVHQVFDKYRDDPEKGKVWKNFVNQYVWDTLQNRYPPEKQQELDLELLSYPSLQNDIMVREEELRPKIMQHSEYQRGNAECHEQNKVIKHVRSEKKYQESQEKLRRKHAEQVLAGEREYYAELEPYLQELKGERKAASP
ncbi:uncharacterized protein CLAFUR5_05320 [Fulvia fulva]|uniref:Uncharacterized protein n=1 Tax=Passalora fulva TaxID=5499 RepID=A0A9Q8P8E1_PASFU|nr:uncharacterized protein CLAFUR5_05320 [Fulvia fulva]KAK4616618.1 hypothetical protein CLAFUR0_10717 [Fulvia fulva]UJO16786.1 hypothetical protein CLAFUR5_05320 [Fulvia fulva]